MVQWIGSIYCHERSHEDANGIPDHARRRGDAADGGRGDGDGPVPCARQDPCQRSCLVCDEPSASRPAPIGCYAKGCIAGAVPLPVNGPSWQVMRLSRNRNWGHPDLVAYSKSSPRDAPRMTAGRPPRRRHVAAARRPDADRPCQPPDRARCRHLVPADARPHAVGRGARDDQLDLADQRQRLERRSGIWTDGFMPPSRSAPRPTRRSRASSSTPAIKQELCDDGRHRPRLAAQDPALVGPRRPFPCPAVLPAGPGRLRRSGRAAARRWLRRGTRLWSEPPPPPPKEPTVQPIKPPPPMIMADLPAACSVVLKAPAAREMCRRPPRSNADAGSDRAGHAGAAEAAVAAGVLGQVLLVVVLGEVERPGRRRSRW